jgi:putative peptide zinc metalloprotease protein
MTATAEPPRPVAAAPTPSALARAEGVELLGDVDGSGYEEGAALVRRADGQMVHLGPLMYALLESIDGHRTTSELAEVISERLGRRCDEEHVAALAEKAAAQGLLAGTEQNAPARRNPLLALRWKVLVSNPRVTKWLTMPFTFLFRPFVMWPVLACFVGVLWFVLIHKGLASATAQAFDQPGLLLLVFLLAVLSAAFHEIGHASACRYGGATPGGMGMGLYLVWPAFYTDVTDSYRLPQRDRLRVDLGGMYFNTIVAVVTMGVWLLVRVDALLLLIALQLLEMVKNLSPMIRSDGYHILSDVTGVPDLFSHLGPTLRRLLPGHREPSALKGRARLIVTVWVLVIVPVLLSLTLGAVLLLPRMLTTAWDSGHAIVANLPHQAGHAQILALIASLLRLVALTLPVVGSVLIAQRLVRGGVGKARSWSAGRPARRVALVVVASAAAAGAAWAWVPSGQYQAVRANEGGTLVGFGKLLSTPQAAARPSTPVSLVRLTPGTHLAVSMIPVGGATKAHPALFVIAGDKGQPAVAILSPSTPDPAGAPVAEQASSTSPTTDTTTTSSNTPTSPPVQATVFPFKLPSAPGPGGTLAVAVGTKDGGITYDVAYSLVTVSKGADVTNSNGAYAFANCKACTTVAVSFQVVLIVGRSANIAPINAAGALNVNCPACITTAVANQIVVTLNAQPSDALLAKLQDALQQLNALPQLGADGTPAAIAAAVTQVQQQIDTELNDSGLVANPPAPTTNSTTTSTNPSAPPAPTTTATTTTTPAATPTTPADTTPASTGPTTTQSSTTSTTTETSTSTTSTSTSTTTTDTTTTETTTTTG